MDKVTSCAFNIDTVCVEVKDADGSMISIYCPRVEGARCFCILNACMEGSTLPHQLCFFPASNLYPTPRTQTI